MTYRAMYKSELADAAGVSRQTLWSWLRSDAKELAAMGVSRNTKLLPPQAVRYLCEKYVIDI